MSEPRVAKLFPNGASQAVRLPAEFRFEGDQVFISRDPVTGDVVLSQPPGANSWDEFFALRDATKVPDEFMATRPMNDESVDRVLFGDDD